MPFGNSEAELTGRALRRHLKKQGVKTPDDIKRAIGDEYSDPRTGKKYRKAGGMNDREIIVADWNSVGSEAEKAESLGLEHSIVRAGVKNIMENHGLINNSKGITDFEPRRDDVFFLVGAGGSVDYKNKNMIAKMAEHGTTFATNRALIPFIGIEETLDYAFLMDSKCYLFVSEDWWDDLDRSKVDCVASFNTHPTALDFNDHYFFGQAAGQTKQWVETAGDYGINIEKFGGLDSGWCSLYSNLHLVHKINPKATIVLYGHDFSFVNNLKYFNQPFNLEAEKENLKHKNFRFVISRDHEGNLLVTQEQLSVQANAIAMALKNFTDAGGRVINASPEGMLYSDFVGIELIPMEEIVKGGVL